MGLSIARLRAISSGFSCGEGRRYRGMLNFGDVFAIFNAAPMYASAVKRP